MVKLNQTYERNNYESRRAIALLLALNALMLLSSLETVGASDRRNDIILTKGKLIMRGDKGNGNIILDTGGKSSEHHSHHEMMMPMMPMMGHHYNPYSFYPMQHQQEHQPMAQMMIHPVYLEDHSAMHSHHEPEHHEHQEHHHEEPHYQHHHQMEHHEPEHQHHHQMEHHEPEHQHHHQMEHHESEQHHEPMGHHYEGHEGHHEEAHGGYETHPMMSMMMHGSGLRPTYEQLAAMQAFQKPIVYAAQQAPHPDQLQEAQQQQQLVQLQQLNQQQQQQQQQQQKETASSNANANANDNANTNSNSNVSANQKQYGSKFTSSLLGQSANNPLAAIIKPLFKWNPLTDKKKPQI